jgi:hypothetical protein
MLLVSLICLVAPAEGGEIFFYDWYQLSIVRFDTREFSSTLVPAPQQILQMGNMGMAYDPASNGLWIYGPTGQFHVTGMYYDIFILVDAAVGSILSYHQEQLFTTTALAFEKYDGSVMIMDDSRSTAWGVPSGSYRSVRGVTGADWYDPGGYVLALTESGDIYELHTSINTVLYAAHIYNPPLYEVELAFDKDTNILWVVRQSGFLEGWDVSTYTQVAWLDTFHQGLFSIDGGAGSVDDVIPQTPELLVTGSCPGTVYVTAVDATPGQHVQIASATRLGRRNLRAGPCAGLAGGLANPVPRFDLVASDAGIASVTLTATAPMCGNLHLQALDLDSCQLTAVRTVPAP